MIHPGCAKRGTHLWTPWYERMSRGDGREISILPDGSFTVDDGEVLFRYRRHCEVLGCDAVEIAADLQPIGVSQIVDRGGSEMLYRPINA